MGEVTGLEVSGHHPHQVGWPRWAYLSMSSVKQNERDGLLPPRVALLGICILDLLAALGIDVLMGYVMPPSFVHRLAIKPDISLTLLSLHTHFIAARYFLSPPGIGAFILTVNRTMGGAFPFLPRRQRILHTTS